MNEGSMAGLQPIRKGKWPVKNDVSDMNFRLQINISRFRSDGPIFDIHILPISLPFSGQPFRFRFKKNENENVRGFSWLFSTDLDLLWNKRKNKGNLED